MLANDPSDLRCSLLLKRAQVLQQKWQYKVGLRRSRVAVRTSWPTAGQPWLSVQKSSAVWCYCWRRRRLGGKPM